MTEGVAHCFENGVVAAAGGVESCAHRCATNPSFVASEMELGVAAAASSAAVTAAAFAAYTDDDASAREEEDAAAEGPYCWDEDPLALARMKLLQAQI